MTANEVRSGGNEFLGRRLARNVKERIVEQFLAKFFEGLRLLGIHEIKLFGAFMVRNVGENHDAWTRCDKR